MSNWSAFKDVVLPAQDAYVDWSLYLDMNRRAQNIWLQLYPRNANDFSGMRAAARDFMRIGGDPEDWVPEKFVELPPPLPVFPVPANAVNVQFAGHIAEQSQDAPWCTDFQKPENVDRDSILLGIIDLDISLSHRRFRTGSGATRFAAAWQQGANHPGPPQSFLPFGQVLYQPDIDTLLGRHSSAGDLTGALDQDGFNRAARLVDYGHRNGVGGLAGRLAHGTHVLGLAGGADPALEPDISDRVRILAVNLPQPYYFGEGGEHLDHYLTFAMMWILEMKRLICCALGCDLPLVTNISIGKQAGSRDERQDFVGAISGMQETVKSPAGQNHTTPPLVIMPAGNDNLEQCHIPIALTGKQPIAEIPWRVQPDDETSNFVEIWTEELDRPTGKPFENPLSVDVVPPGAEDGTFLTAGNRQVSTMEGALAHIYCDVVEHPEPGVDTVRVRYLICLSPGNFRPRPGAKPPAPAGLWRIRLRGNGSRLRVRASIQTDQMVLPGRSGTRRSYFDDPFYERFERSGREADSYSYQNYTKKKNLDVHGMVRRHGTLNSYAANKYVTVVGGFRDGDGRPALYSATGKGYTTGPHDRGAQTAALVSEDGHALFGVLSDGAADGAMIAASGTSFASACAARLIVDAWLTKKLKKGQSARQYLWKMADRDEHQPRWLGIETDIEKRGGGRVAFVPRRKTSRR